MRNILHGMSGVSLCEVELCANEVFLSIMLLWVTGKEVFS